MNYIKILFLILGFLNFSCENYQMEQTILIEDKNPIIVYEVDIIKTIKDSVNELFSSNPVYLANGFDFPVGKPDSKGYYNAQGFGVSAHLGDDWNGVGGGNSDLGDPIFSIANGYVNFALDYEGGWGKVIRIWHQINDSIIVESLYAHCDTMYVRQGKFVNKGDKIGTIGNAGGVYLAHLHFEIRDSIGMLIGGGYDPITDSYVNPTLFIKKNR